MRYFFMLLLTVFVANTQAADKKITKASGDIGLKCGELHNGQLYPLEIDFIYSPSNKAQFFKRYTKGLQLDYLLTMSNEYPSTFMFEVSNSSDKPHRFILDRKNLKLQEQKRPSWATEPEFRSYVFYQCELMSDDQFRQAIVGRIEDNKRIEKEAKSGNKI